MPKVKLVCEKCGYEAKRELAWDIGSRGIHETASEPARCPKGHGSLVRKDGGSIQKQLPGQTDNLVVAYQKKERR